MAIHGWGGGGCGHDSPFAPSPLSYSIGRGYAPSVQSREYTSYLGCCWGGGGGDRDQSNRSLSACPPLLSNVLILDVIATYM